MGIINLMWLLLCGVLVCFMQAGFAMLEAGFIRAKNVANIAMKNIMDICIGAVAGIVVVNSIGILDKVFKVDDPVGAVSAHGVSGILGTLMTGLLATDKGLFYTGNAEFFGVQLLGSVVVTASMLVVMAISISN